MIAWPSYLVIQHGLGSSALLRPATGYGPSTKRAWLWPCSLSIEPGAASSPILTANSITSLGSANPRCILPIYMRALTPPLPQLQTELTRRPKEIRRALQTAIPSRRSSPRSSNKTQGVMAPKAEIPWTAVVSRKYARVGKQLANGSASEDDDLKKGCGQTGIKGSVSYRQPYVLYDDDEVTTIEVPWVAKGTRRQRKKLAAARKCLVVTKHGIGYYVF